MKRFGSIYLVTNKRNGKLYIGQTTDTLNQRWASHKSLAKHLKTPLARAIMKYGHETFQIEEICSCGDKTALDTMERVFIEEYNSMIPAGYNLTNGGFAGNKQSDYTRNKKSRAHKERYKDPAQRERQSRISKAFWASATEEQLKERSDKIKAKITDEHRQKLSQIHTGKKYARGNTNKRFPVLAIHVETGLSYAFEFNQLAADSLQMSGAGISVVINGKRPHNKGFTFKRLTEDEYLNYQNMPLDEFLAQAKPKRKWHHIRCIEVATNKTYEFETAVAAARALDLHDSDICMRLNGKRKGLHKGFRFEPIN